MKTQEAWAVVKRGVVESWNENRDFLYNTPVLILIPDEGEDVAKIFEDMKNVCALDAIRNGNKPRVLKDGRYVVEGERENE